MTEYAVGEVTPRKFTVMQRATPRSTWRSLAYATTEVGAAVIVRALEAYRDGNIAARANKSTDTPREAA